MASVATLAVRITGDVTDVQSKLNSMAQSMESAAKKMKNVGTALTGAVSLPILGMGGAALKAAADNEQLEVAFTTMLGSAEKAKNLMADLSTFAAETPFESAEIQSGAKMLLAYGVSAETVTDEMRRLGDIAAGVGTPIQDLAYLYGTARVQGRLFTADINQFTGRGIPIMEALAATMGVATGEIRGMVEEGKIGFPELQAALAYLTDDGGKFAGLMEAQSQTLSGLFSTLKDNIALSMIDIGNAIAQAFDLKTNAVTAIAFVERIRDTIADLSKNNPELLRLGVIIAVVAAAVGPLVVGLGWLLGAIAPLAPVVGLLGSALGLLVSPLGLVVAGFAALIAFDVGGLGTMLGDLGRYLAEVTVGGDYLNDWLTHLPAAVQPAALALGKFVAAVGGLAQTGDVSAFVDELRTSFPTAAAAVDTAIGTITTAVDAAATSFSAAQGAVSTFLATDTWTTAQETITGSLGAIGESFAGLFTGDVSLAELKDTVLTEFGAIGTALSELFASEDFAGLAGGLLAAFGLEGMPAQITAQVEPIQTAFQPLVDFLAPTFERLKETVGGLPEQFGALGEKFGPLKEAATELGAAFSSLFSGGEGGGALGVSLLGAALAGTLSVLTNTVNGLLGALAPLGGALIDQLTTLLSGLATVVTGLGTAFAGIVANDPKIVLEGLGVAFQGVKDIIAGTFENSLTAVQVALAAIGEIVTTTLADWGFGAAAESVQTLVADITTLLEKIKAISNGDAAINFAAPDWIVQLLEWLWPSLDLPEAVESLLSWQWPDMTLPEILDSLLAWVWPGFPGLPGWVSDLMDWSWPSFEMPTWLNELFNFKWPTFSAPFWWPGGGGTDGKGQLGITYARGGNYLVGEGGREIVTLPRGAGVIPNRQTEEILGAGGDVNVTIQYANLTSEADSWRLAYQIDDLHRRRRR